MIRLIGQFFQNCQGLFGSTTSLVERQRFIDQNLKDTLYPQLNRLKDGQSTPKKLAFFFGMYEIEFMTVQKREYWLNWSAQDVYNIILKWTTCEDLAKETSRLYANVVFGIVDTIKDDNIDLDEMAGVLSSQISLQA